MAPHDQGNGGTTNCRGNNNDDADGEDDVEHDYFTDDVDDEDGDEDEDEDEDDDGGVLMMMMMMAETSLNTFAFQASSIPYTGGIQSNTAPEAFPTSWLYKTPQFPGPSIQARTSYYTCLQIP